MSFHGLKAHFFLAPNNIPFVWMYHSLFIHSPTKGHFGCFQVWAITDKAAINIYVQGFVRTEVFSFLGSITRSAVTGTHAKSMFSFVRNHFQSDFTILNYYQQEMRSPVVPHLHICCQCSVSGHSIRCVVVSHYCFNLHSPDDVWCGHFP